jgi:hypothetical protein
VEGRQVPLSQTLAEAGTGPGSLITYWTQIVIRDETSNRSFYGDVIHMATGHDLALARSSQKRRAETIELYEAQIRDRFAEADRRLGALGGGG